MKKIIALALCLIMVLSLGIAVSAVDVANVGKVESGYAPEGTGIDSLDKITDAAGKYYLTADIKVTASFATDFKGVLDGNGKKVTLEAPMFLKATNATFKNLVLEGTLNFTEAPYKFANVPYAAALVCDAKLACTFQNIISNVSVTSNVADLTLAGFVGTSSADKYVLTFENCVNTGAITAPNYAAGFIGNGFRKGDIIMKNCVNTGAITADKGVAGGLLAKMYNSASGTNQFYDCVNSGNVTSTNAQAGGIVGYAQVYVTAVNCTNAGAISANAEAGGISGCVQEVPSGYDGVHTYRGCVNNGTVESLSNKSGGINGYTWSSGSRDYIDIQACVNTAVITGKTFVSQMCAYSNSVNNIVKNNIMTGSVKGNSESTHLAFIGGSSADLPTYDMQNNYMLEGHGYAHYTYTESSGKEANILTFDQRVEGSLIIVTEAQIASGELTEAINAAVKEAYLRQTIGTDKVPTVDPASKFVFKGTDGKLTNVDEKPSYTEAPTTTEETTKKPKPTTPPPVSTDAPTTEASQQTTEAPKEEKGCGGMVAGSIAVIAVLSIGAVVIKKKD